MCGGGGGEVKTIWLGIKRCRFESCIWQTLPTHHHSQRIYDELASHSLSPTSFQADCIVLTGGTHNDYVICRIEFNLMYLVIIRCDWFWRLCSKSTSLWFCWCALAFGPNAVANLRAFGMEYRFGMFVMGWSCLQPGTSCCFLEGGELSVWSFKLNSSGPMELDHRCVHAQEYGGAKIVMSLLCGNISKYYVNQHSSLLCCVFSPYFSNLLFLRCNTEFC